MRAPIKIVHLLYSGLGGHASVFFNIVNTNNTTEFSHFGLFGGVENLNNDSKIRCLENKISFDFLLKKQGFDFKFYYQILKILCRERPKIIMLHGGSFLLPVILYKLLKINTKLILRDTQAAHLKKKSEWYLLILSHFLCNKLVFLTEESRSSLKEKIPFWFNKSKTVIISNGIDLIKYQKVNPSINFKTPIIIGMQSRLQLIKDHPTLIKAFSLLADNNPHYELHIAGDGTTLESLIKLVKDLKLENKVFFNGLLNEAELLNFMGTLDIYIHATFGETLSNSILQAMACGLPIVASDVKGVNNLITDGLSGLLYESENINQLMEKIQYLIINSSSARELGDFARIEVEKHYSNEIMSLKYQKTFVRMIKE